MNSVCPLQWLLASLPSLLKLSCITLPTQLSLPTKAVVLKAQLMLPLLQCSYQCIRSSRDNTHTSCLQELLPEALSEQIIYAIIAQFCYYSAHILCSFKTRKETSSFLQYEQSCWLVMTECIELHTYHKVMPCAPYRNRDHCCFHLQNGCKLLCWRMSSCGFSVLFRQTLDQNYTCSPTFFFLLM